MLITGGAPIMQTDYLDLYLIHWPARTVPNETSDLFPVTASGARNVDWDWDQARTWSQMEALMATGKVKAIGVSNFSEILLKQLSKTWKVVPAVNQVGLWKPKDRLSDGGRASPVQPTTLAEKLLRSPRDSSGGLLASGIN
jgi:diketogulonate reductase-like aldo/keto reductase